MPTLKKRCFSLLEVMIAVLLLALAAGTIGRNLHQMIVRKRFSSGVEKIRARLDTCRRLALNSQSDWQCTLTQKGESWTLHSTSMEGLERLSPPDLEVGPFLLTLNGEKQNAIAFGFTSTGEVFPKGALQLRRVKGESPVEWKLPDLFLVEEGSKGGPVQPR